MKFSGICRSHRAFILFYFANEKNLTIQETLRSLCSLRVNNIGSKQLNISTCNGGKGQRHRTRIHKGRPAVKIFFLTFFSKFIDFLEILYNFQHKFSFLAL